MRGPTPNLPVKEPFIHLFKLYSLRTKPTPDNKLGTYCCGLDVPCALAFQSIQSNKEGSHYTNYLVMVEAVRALLRPMATAIGSDHLGVQLLISNLILQFGHFTYKSLIFKSNLVWF